MRRAHSGHERWQRATNELAGDIDAATVLVRAGTRFIRALAGLVLAVGFLVAVLLLVL